MSALSTVVRATHLVTNAAWFGGSLMGAVGLNGAAATADDPRERVRLAGEGWGRWGPVQGAAIGLHLLTGVGILVDNRRRTVLHDHTRRAVGAKTLLTGAALASSAAAYVLGQRVGELADASVVDSTEPGPGTPDALARRQRLLDLVQWTTPLLSGALLVLDADLGETQRGTAGLLDRPVGAR